MEQGMDKRKPDGACEKDAHHGATADTATVQPLDSNSAGQGEPLDPELAQRPCEFSPKPKDSDISALGLILLFALLIQITIFSPQIIGAIANLVKPSERVFLGTVQKVTFIGGFGASTQVDTESHSVLLRGAANIRQGARLERRKDSWAVQVCDMQTGACWDLISQ
jgi:hypothetical protein